MKPFCAKKSCETGSFRVITKPMLTISICTAVATRARYGLISPPIVRERLPGAPTDLDSRTRRLEAAAGG